MAGDGMNIPGGGNDTKFTSPPMSMVLIISMGDMANAMMVRSIFRAMVAASITNSKLMEAICFNMVAVVANSMVAVGGNAPATKVDTKISNGLWAASL